MKMALLERFNAALERRYLFHLHTTYTDGGSTIHAYCEWALEKAFDVVIFTEHVRRELSYDFSNFLRDIDVARRSFPSLDIWVGVEAKVLPGGKLDLPRAFLPDIQVVGLAYHSSVPSNIAVYKEALLQAFSLQRLENFVSVWVHPGRCLMQANMLLQKLELLNDLLIAATAQEVFIEMNARYELPIEALRSVPASWLVKGYDAHSLADLNLPVRTNLEGKDNNSQ